MAAVATPGTASSGPPVRVKNGIAMNCRPDFDFAERCGEVSQERLQTILIEIEVDDKGLCEHGVVPSD